MTTDHADNNNVAAPRWWRQSNTWLHVPLTCPRGGGGRSNSCSTVVVLLAAPATTGQLFCPFSSRPFSPRSASVENIDEDNNDTLTTVAAASGEVDDGTPSLSLSPTTTEKRTASHYRCSPPLMDGYCVAHSVVCRPICHPPLLSSCDCQHFLRRPQSPVTITNFCQPLSCHLSQPSITFSAPVNGWLLCSLPAKQHTNRTTKLKTFPVSTLLDLV